MIRLIDIIRTRGTWSFKLRNIRTGRIDAEGELIPNTFTDKGRKLIFKLLNNESGVTGAKHIAIGTDNTAPTTGDTTLGAEINGDAEGRELISIYTFNEAGSPIKTDYTAFWDAYTPSSTQTLWEFGLFGNSAKVKDDGYLIARAVLSASVTKIYATHTLEVTYTLQFA